MKYRFVILGMLVIAAAPYSAAFAYKLAAPGGVCPKDPKIQCQIVCDNGQTADYMKWTGAGWSNLVGTIKDGDMNGEAKKLIAKSNSDNKMLGGAPDCK